MDRILHTALVVAFLCAMAVPSQTASILTPQRGSSERTMILDAVRPTMQREIGGDIAFKVSVIRTDGQWAFVQAVPQRPNGRAIDWAATKFADEWRKDMMSDIVMALLQRSGQQWRVVKYVIGPTDVFWLTWASEYRLPTALFTAE